MHVAALDALAIGIAVCDPGGQVRFANVTAEEMLRQKVGVTYGPRGRELSAVAPADARALARLIEDAARGGRGGAIRLSDKNVTRLIASVTPLPPHLEPDYGSGYLLVTMQAAPRGVHAFSAEVLVALFDLSPTQASIATAIFNGDSPEEIARSRGIKISTLRTHLAEIFLRTGAENQRDLVRLLGTLPPLRG